MELRRSNLAYDLAIQLVRSYDITAFAPSYRNTENIPKTGPVLFVPKHRLETDIPLEAGLIYPRRGNWVMKGILPKWLELIGGISVIRARDIHKKAREISRDSKCLSREELKIARLELENIGRQQNAEVLEYLKFLYSTEEVIFVHPEGTRSSEAVPKLKMDLINHAIGCSNELGIDISIVPIGIVYGGKKALEIPYGKNKRLVFRREVTLKVGEPIPHDSNNLELIIRENLASLSNIKL